MDTLTRRSPAKINLTLRIIGTRPDGFHELESLIARVDFCDELTVAAMDPCYSCTERMAIVDAASGEMQIMTREEMESTRGRAARRRVGDRI